MMIVTIVAAALAMQAGSADQRQAYTSCLNQAVASARGESVGVDAFKAYAQKTCASVEGSFRSKLVAFNVKNGMSKKTADEDAQIQLDDYFYTYEEKYRYAAQPQ